MMYSYCTLIMYDYNHHHYLLKCTAYYDMGIENLKRVRKGLYCGSQTVKRFVCMKILAQYMNNTMTKASPTSSLNLAFQFSVPEAANLK